MLQSFEKCEKQPFKKRDFCSILWGDFFHSAKMTSDFRKYTAVVCRIYEISDFFRKSRKNGVFYLYIFERNVLYYGGCCNSNKDDRQNAQVSCRFYADIRNFRLFYKIYDDYAILPPI